MDLRFLLYKSILKICYKINTFELNKNKTTYFNLEFVSEHNSKFKKHGFKTICWQNYACPMLQDKLIAKHKIDKAIIYKHKFDL